MAHEYGLPSSNALPGSSPSNTLRSMLPWEIRTMHHPHPRHSWKQDHPSVSLAMYPQMEAFLRRRGLFSLCSLLCLLPPLHARGDLQTYIIHLHPHTHPTAVSSAPASPVRSELLRWHLSYLERSTVLSEDEEELSSRLVYSYHSAVDGFAARLSSEEAEALRGMPGVAAVRADRRLELHTTYSHQFLGLGSSPGGAWARSGFGSGAIIGVLDTGVWPESPSFRDGRMPPVPRRWRGVCQEGQLFNSSCCNRKLIGARYYIRGHHSSPPPTEPATPPAVEYISARDAHGHGTHTASTAAGAAVPNAGVLGVGTGVAMGTAPGAHVAVYKVCWFSGCYSSDILAGIDDAIGDGVDVLSLSLGGFPLPLFEDNIAIGAFRATERGVLVVCAAGNSGPLPSSVANAAPWIATVGASTMDRRFPAFIRMGNGQLLYGESMFPGNHFLKHGGKALEVVYEAAGNRGGEFCFKGSLSTARVAGKMVICDRGINGRAEKGEVVREAGGAAMVLANAEINMEEDSVDVHVLPATLIGYNESLRLKSYMNFTRRPVAQIEFGGTTWRARAPAVALFSSRGPSLTDPSVLKPDVVAPGVNIVAAWPQNLGPSGLPEDLRRVEFSVLSGTSMACPHVSGIAALVRSAHPSWSPSAVKSAIMTTADIVDHYGKPIMDGAVPAGVFALGAGHVNPTRAIDPGLVYDIKPEEYVVHLCTIGYTNAEVSTITHRNTSCRVVLSQNRGFSLNYPSIAVVFKSGETRKMIQRTVTNVGSPNSTYLVQVTAMEGVRVRVIPRSLAFTSVNQSKSYRVWFQSRKGALKGKTSHEEGQLTWVHSRQAQYKVRSPIAVTWAR